MLSAVRQDAWNHDDDLLLAEVVLRHIREGSTQLTAFEEVGDRLSRTPAACGFRWNSLVRKNYQSAIELAKKQRKQLKDQQGEFTNPASQSEREENPTLSDSPNIEQEAATSKQPSSLTLEDVIVFLKKFRSGEQQQEGLLHENEQLTGEVESLRKKNKSLEKQIAHIQKEHQSIQEDYKSLIAIMERARKMAVFQEDREQGKDTKSKNSLQKIE